MIVINRAESTKDETRLSWQSLLLPYFALFQAFLFVFALIRLNSYTACSFSFSICANFAVVGLKTELFGASGERWVNSVGLSWGRHVLSRVTRARITATRSKCESRSWGVRIDRLTVLKLLSARISRRIPWQRPCPATDRLPHPWPSWTTSVRLNFCEKWLKLYISQWHTRIYFFQESSQKVKHENYFCIAIRWISTQTPNISLQHRAYVSK